MDKFQETVKFSTFQDSLQNFMNFRTHSGLGECVMAKQISEF